MMVSYVVLQFIQISFQDGCQVLNCTIRKKRYPHSDRGGGDFVAVTSIDLLQHLKNSAPMRGQVNVTSPAN